MKKPSKSKEILAPVIAIVAFVVLWQVVYELGLFPKLSFPSVPDIFNALVEGFAQRQMAESVLYTMRLIVEGILLGVVLAFICSALSIFSKTFNRIYNMIIAVCDPLPGIALLPLAMLWFGMGEGTIMFLIVHSVLWPFSRNIIDGFRATPAIYDEIGRNIGLKGIRLFWGVYLPASFPYILSGLKVGWARAWRAVISAEMIFSIANSGIGWYIFTRKYQYDIPGMYAALVVIIVIGLIIEYGLFATVEKHTVRKWGVVR